MKPLIVLLGSFVISFFAIRIFLGAYDLAFAGRIALSVMLLFTAIAHFAFTKGMSMMIPGNLPFKNGLVRFTGIIEILAAIGLQIAALRELTGILLILFFVAILPANIYAAFKHIDYREGTYTGKGPAYLWFRVPLQVLFITWTGFSVWPCC